MGCTFWAPLWPTPCPGADARGCENLLGGLRAPGTRGPADGVLMGNLEGGTEQGLWLGGVGPGRQGTKLLSSGHPALLLVGVLVTAATLPSSSWELRELCLLGRAQQAGAADRVTIC